MSKPPRLPRPKADIEDALKDQLQLLRIACENFDNGVDAAGIQIATILRVMLHATKTSRALLDQLGYRKGRFYSTGPEYNARNMANSFPLLTMVFGTNGGFYAPKIFVAQSNAPRLVQFVDWWGETIIKDGNGNRFSRMSLVGHVANTDGGAHVDPGFDSDYRSLSRENSLGMMFKSSTKNVALAGRPHLACMRQIAHEVLCTIQTFVPAFKDFAVPVIPVYEDSLINASSLRRLDL